MISSLTEQQIFVFGSNLAGNHAGGAARQAKEQFGAEDGIGEGLTGRCYAFPTLERDMNQRGQRALETARNRFYATARALPEKEFLLTKVGCGIAGYPEEQMRGLFLNPPTNVILPEEWRT